MPPGGIPLGMPPHMMRGPPMGMQPMMVNP